MTTYFYQYREEDERQLIDTHVHAGFERRGKVEADSWLGAKQEFGFELTVLQKRMLELHD